MHLPDTGTKILQPRVRFTGATYEEAYRGWSAETEERQCSGHPRCSQLVYLTPDSPNTLEGLSKGHAYVIGGITDKNRYKRLCLEKAEHDNIKTARLPIEEYVTMSSRKVLPINTGISYAPAVFSRLIPSSPSFQHSLEAPQLRGLDRGAHGIHTEQEKRRAKDTSIQGQPCRRRIKQCFDVSPGPCSWQRAARDRLK